jgi:hypothetical protein
MHIELKALAVALLFLSCNPPIPGGGWLAGDPRVYVRPDVIDQRPEYYRALLRASRDYCNAGLGCVALYIGEGNNEIRVTESSEAAGCTPNVLACTRHYLGKRVVFVPRTIWGKPLLFVGKAECNGRTKVEAYPLAAHELGHVLGFKHSSDRNSVMFPRHVCGARGLPE